MLVPTLLLDRRCQLHCLRVAGLLDFDFYFDFKFPEFWFWFWSLVSCTKHMPMVCFYSKNQNAPASLCWLYFWLCQKFLLYIKYKACHNTIYTAWINLHWAEENQKILLYELPWNTTQFDKAYQRGPNNKFFPNKA